MSRPHRGVRFATPEQWHRALRDYCRHAAATSTSTSFCWAIQSAHTMTWSELLVLTRSPPTRLKLQPADRLISFGYSAYSLPCSAPQLSSGPRRRCAGIGADFVGTGAGSRDVASAGHVSQLTSATWRTISRENAIWGIHVELLRLGIDVAQSTVGQAHDPATAAAFACLVGMPVPSRGDPKITQCREFDN
jgi:hypothetical protein